MKESFDLCKAVHAHKMWRSVQKRKINVIVKSLIFIFIVLQSSVITNKTILAAMVLRIKIFWKTLRFRRYGYVHHFAMKLMLSWKLWENAQARKNGHELRLLECSFLGKLSNINKPFECTGNFVFVCSNLLKIRIRT